MKKNSATLLGITYHKSLKQTGKNIIKRDEMIFLRQFDDLTLHPTLKDEVPSYNCEKWSSIQSTRTFSGGKLQQFPDVIKLLMIFGVINNPTILRCHKVINDF